MHNRFEIKKEHLKLMQNFNIEWDGSMYRGAPEVDIKRPYGDKDVFRNMLDILGMQKVADNIFKFKIFDQEFTLIPDSCGDLNLSESPEGLRLIDILLRLHEQTETALLICLCNLSFETGIYEEEEYRKWKKIK